MNDAVDLSEPSVAVPPWVVTTSTLLNEALHPTLSSYSSHVEDTPP
jgi:hypothetical protein